MGFSNPIIGGGGSLVYPSIHSPNFDVSNPTGSPTPSWAILKNGLAYFFGLILQGGTITGPDYIFNSNGLFFYSSTPATGNLIAWFAPAAGTDQFGNTFTEGLNVGGAMQNIALIPLQNSAFNITSAIAGTLDAVAALGSGDASQIIPGILGSLLLNTGTATKQSTVLGSPMGTGSAAYIVLESENDGGTDNPVITFGIASTPDDGTTIVYTPIIAIGPYYFLLYSGSSGTTVVTKTSGSGTITGLPATVKAETWGAGASSAGVSGGPSALGGNGSGGYSCETALATTGSVTYSVPASANGLGGTPPDCTIVGSSVTVTAHSGTAGTTLGAGNGANASGNTIAFAGARGGAPSGADPGGGGGGGGSGGPGGAGQHGSGGSPTAGGAGGSPVSGGGVGGKGGSPTGNGSPGTAPGGGGGGGSTNADGAIGGAGQAKVTYTGTAPQILFSIATVSGTDQFGTTFSAGMSDPNTYVTGGQLINSLTATPITGMTGIPVTAGITYKIRGTIVMQQGGVAAGNNGVQFSGPAITKMTVTYVTIEGNTIFASGLVNALNSSMQTGAVPVSTIGSLKFDGIAVFNTSGNLELTALCITAAADTWTVGSQSFVEVVPLS